MILFNSYKFFTNYASLEKIELPEEPDQAPTLLDQWILTRLDETVLYMNKNLEEYNLQKAVGLIKPFVNDLSTWYIRRSRDRVGPSATNQEDKMLCYTTLNVVFEVFLRAIAPITPFVCEYLYRHQTSKESIHLQDYPSVINESVINKDLLTQMELVRKVCELGHAQRKSLNLAVKQALNSATVTGAEGLKDKNELVSLIKDELNIEKVIFTQGGDLSVTLDQVLDERLIAKGEARQIMRAIQEARKESACRLDEVVELVLPDWPKLFEEEIKQQTLVSKITKGDKLTVIRNDQ
jgi:isoleucyl-tRNA synthetase